MTVPSAALLSALPTRFRTPRTVTVGAVAAALALSGAGLALPAHAAVSTAAPVLINEVYGGGGNSGAAYANDFVELVNVGDETASLGGWSLQYASFDGSSWTNKLDLSGSIPAGGSFLIQLRAGSNGGPALPTPDLSGTIDLSGTRGKVALVDTTTTLTGATGNANANAAVIDFVGYGADASDFGGSAPAPGTTNATSVTRNAEHTNTADNGADFAAATPTPEGSTSAGGGDPDPDPTASPAPSPSPSPSSTPPPAPDGVTPIAEIQGAGAATPLAGQTVTTEGVVTARYATGGLNGYVIQTSGTGGAIDPATHAASDAIFVYSAATVGGVSIGDAVRVTGTAGEFRGQTQLTVPEGGAEVIAAQPAPTPASIAWPAADAAREPLESMLLQPQGPMTVTDTYGTNQYGEVGLAAGTGPLRQPTDVAPFGSPEADAVAQDNAARAVLLDDGSSINFLDDSGANATSIPPYISLTEPVVVGASVSFDEPIILGYGFDAWRFQPTEPVVGDGTGENDGVTFSNPRTAAPAPVGGDLSVASFNVLNYFTTLGDSTRGCESYGPARNGEENSVAGGCDARGAWDADDLARQQAKIVSAIDALDASVVGLMEIENSARLGETPDEATSTLVAALNAAAGSEKWDFVPSSAELPPASGQDVITNAIIYQPALAEPVGASRALGDLSDDGEAFGNAREPIGQVFAPKAGGEEFFFVVNHFKSKGSAPSSGPNADNGQGAWNAARTAQAQALAAWADEVKGDVESVVLVGDFNSYAQEDPLRALYAAGYVDAEQEFGAGDSSYSFDGLVGSLDHVLLNAAAAERATGADVWNINSGEAPALEYTRYRYHGADFLDDGPYRSSDHDPVKVGLSRLAEAPVQIDLVTINDFHGRLEPGSQGEAGAAVLAAAVKAKEDANPNTLFVSAGDNIGASTFTSNIQQDNPTIDTLVAAGLDVSAVGNHEFDRGFDDLLNRVIPRFGGNSDPAAITAAQRDAGNPYGLGANVYAKGTTTPVLPEYAVKTVDGVRVAFIGTVTTDTATLVNPDGVEDITFGDQLTAANRVSKTIVDGDLADVIVLLTHSGAGSSNDCPALAAGDSEFAELARGASADIDAIVSAHTHQTYACEVPVAGTDHARPIIQAAEYGKAIGQLSISYDADKGELIGITGTTEPLTAADYPADAAIAAQVKVYVDAANVLGSRVIGTITDSVLRGGTAGSDRGVESTAGNSVADWYLWATSVNPAYAGPAAQIAIMNPGGLRADLVKTGTGEVTYKQVADVQPFANTLVTMKLTGAQLKDILGRQWETTGVTGGRPKLHLGVSEGFTYEYTEGPPPAGTTVPNSGAIVSMSYQGEKIADTDVFTVVTNSFLAAGGDGFAPFAQGTDRRDTGTVDLDATLAYFQAVDPVSPSPLGRSVKVSTTEPTPPPAPGAGVGTPPAPVDPGGSIPGAGVQVGGSWAKVALSDGGRVEQGGSLQVTLTGLTPGQRVAATLFSTPVTVPGIPAADASGTTRFAVAIPAGFDLGAHRLVITTPGLDPIQVGVTVVRPGGLAVTGAEGPWGIALGGAFLLVAGGLAVALRRRPVRPPA